MCAEECDYEYDDNISNDRKRGMRAEEVAEWYFRLNGFFLMPGFIVHPDMIHSTPRTEADLLGIHLKGSSEGIWRPIKSDHFRDRKSHQSMVDDQLLTDSSMIGTVKKSLVIMVEVKAGTCSINGPWSDRHARDNEPGKSNMERALSRVGFGNRAEIQKAGTEMYDNLRYEGKEFIVQYIAVGKVISKSLQEKHPRLLQITFDQIAAFLHGRFKGFPEKIPTDRDVQLWRGFGDYFWHWFEAKGYHSTPTIQDCQLAVLNYIDGRTC